MDDLPDPALTLTDPDFTPDFSTQGWQWVVESLTIPEVTQPHRIMVIRLGFPEPPTESCECGVRSSFSERPKVCLAARELGLVGPRQEGVHEQSQALAHSELSEPFRAQCTMAMHEAMAYVSCEPSIRPREAFGWG